MSQKAGCSFRDYDWGIATWPTIQKTESGDAHRHTEKVQKQQSNARAKGNKSAVAVQRSIPEGSIPTNSASTRTTRPKKPAKGSTLATTVQPIPAPVPGPSTLGLSANTSFPQSPFTFSVPPFGRAGISYSQYVTFGELGPFAAVLRNPARDFTMVCEARSNLRAMYNQEEADLKTLTELVEERREIVEVLFEQLCAEREAIAAREGIVLIPGGNTL